MTPPLGSGNKHTHVPAVHPSLVLGVLAAASVAATGGWGSVRNGVVPSFTALPHSPGVLVE